MIPTVKILDTGTGPNLFSIELLPQEWLGTVKQIADPVLKEETRYIVNIQEVILLNVQIEDLRVPVCFGVVTIPDVSVLLGSKFINKFVTGIFHLELKVVPQKSRSVDIIQKAPPTQRVMKIHDKRNQADKILRDKE